MQTLVTIRVGFFGVLVGCSILSVVPCTTADEERIGKLKQERVDVLMELVKAREIQYANGTTNVQAVIEAQAELLQASLDLEESEDRRLHYVRRMLALARQAETLAEARIATGISTLDESLLLRAHRLKIQIKYAEMGGDEEADFDAEDEIIDKINDYFDDK